MVALEWQEFKENIALDGSDKRWWGEYTTRKIDASNEGEETNES